MLINAMPTCFNSRIVPDELSQPPVVNRTEKLLDLHGHIIGIVSIQFCIT